MVPPKDRAPPLHFVSSLSPSNLSPLNDFDRGTPGVSTPRRAKSGFRAVVSGLKLQFSSSPFIIPRFPFSSD